MQPNEQMTPKPSASDALAAGRHLEGAAKPIEAGKAIESAKEGALAAPTPIHDESEASESSAFSPSASALWTAAADLGAYMMTAPRVQAELMTSAYLGWTKYWLRALGSRAAPGSTGKP